MHLEVHFRTNISADVVSEKQHSTHSVSITKPEGAKEIIQANGKNIVHFGK